MTSTTHPFRSPIWFLAFSTLLAVLLLAACRSNPSPVPTHSNTPALPHSNTPTPSLPPSLTATSTLTPEPRTSCIAFVSDYEGNDEIYLAPLTGGEALNLTGNPAAPGLDVQASVVPVDRRPDPRHYDAVVLGSAVYGGA